MTTFLKNLLTTLACALLAGCATVPGLGGWREEVQLHDGRTIVVHRSQTYGGLHEINQSAPVRSQEIGFTVPETGKRYHFESEYSEDVGRANLKIIALHVKDAIPYLVTTPNLCLAYNKWGRPNPPYVIFRHDGQEWKRISISELPPEFKTINLMVETKNKEPRAGMLGLVSTAEVRQANKSLPQKEYKEILRGAMQETVGGCSVLIHTNDGWEGLMFFKTRGSLEACRDYCRQKTVTNESCPCDALFLGNGK